MCLSRQTYITLIAVPPKIALDNVHFFCYFTAFNSLAAISGIATCCILVTLLGAHAAVLSRFTCSENGKSTQTCEMKCDYDGFCTETLRVVSCNCEGYGSETYDLNNYQASF